MQVVACSPLTKLFLPEWEERLLENPELVFDESIQFSFSVPRPAGAVEGVQYGVPFTADAHIPRHRDKDGKEGLSLLFWLAGDDQGDLPQETDWTGIVRVKGGQKDAEQDMAHAYSKIMQAQMSKNATAMAKAQAEAEAIIKKHAESIGEALKAARPAADARVIRQLKTTHRNLLEQYKHNKEDGKGLYRPTSTEHLGAYVLRKLVTVSKGRREMNAQFKTLIDQTWMA